MHTENKIHGANMGPIWVLSASNGPHVGPMNLAIRFIHWTEDVTGTRNRGTEHLENVSRKFVCFLQWNLTGFISDGYVFIGGRAIIWTNIDIVLWRFT